MNRRVTRLLLALYPRAWRDRYGAEVTSLTDELIRAGETTPLPAGLNLVAGAMTERARELAGSRNALAVMSAAVIIAMVGGAYAVTGSARPGPAPRAVVGGNCLVQPLFQVRLSGAPGTRLQPVARTPFSDRPPSGRLPPGARRLSGPRLSGPEPGRLRLTGRRLAVAVAVAKPARPQVRVTRSDRVARTRPAKINRILRIAWSCERSSAAAQKPVPGPARTLRVQPPVPVATRVTR